MSREIANTDGRGFDPSRYLRKLGGKDYLEVKWRLLWLRSEHPDALIVTELVRLEGDFALFKATVSIPEGGTATGYGSETKADFFDFIEKAETKALGRALAALGYGTQFCDDHDFSVGSADGGKVVDSPVERHPSIERSDGQSGGTLATAPQLKMIYLTATKDLNWTEEELEVRCKENYDRLPVQLTKREASSLIEWMKGGAQGSTPGGPAPTPRTVEPQQVHQPSATPAQPATPQKANKEQLAAIARMGGQLGYSKEQLRTACQQIYQHDPEQLTFAEAVDWLKTLQVDLQAKGV